MLVSCRKGERGDEMDQLATLGVFDAASLPAESMKKKKRKADWNPVEEARKRHPVVQLLVEFCLRNYGGELPKLTPDNVSHEVLKEFTPTHHAAPPRQDDDAPTFTVEFVIVQQPPPPPDQETATKKKQQVDEYLQRWPASAAAFNFLSTDAGWRGAAEWTAAGQPRCVRWCCRQVLVPRRSDAETQPSQSDAGNGPLWPMCDPVERSPLQSEALRSRARATGEFEADVRSAAAGAPVVHAAPRAN